LEQGKLRQLERRKPCEGQCNVTSLVVQDLFGGSILKTRTRAGTLFYNLIDCVRWT
jgi:hypothetical protein